MNWIPAVTSTGLLAIALWLARNLISARLLKSVEHEFNEKIERIRSDHRQKEQSLRAELNARTAEIEAIRAGALSAMSGRQAAIDRRRLEAIDQLWTSVTALGPARTLAQALSGLKIDELGKAVERDEKMRKFVETIGFGFDINKLDIGNAAKSRPFVSPMTWAIYSAMQAVTGHAIIQWTALKSGVNPKGLVDEERVKTLIKSALPHFSDYVDEHGASVFFYTLDALEGQLLSSIQKMLDGTEDDKATIERAAIILKHSNELIKVPKSTDNEPAMQRQ